MKVFGYTHEGWTDVELEQDPEIEKTGTKYFVASDGSLRYVIAPAGWAFAWVPINEDSDDRILIRDYRAWLRFAREELTTLATLHCLDQAFNWLEAQTLELERREREESEPSYD